MVPQPLPNRTAKILLWLVLLPAWMPAWAASYTTYTGAAIAAQYPWIDISTSGTTLALGDDDISATLSIGFTFVYGDNAYTGFKVMSNGQVQFGGSDTTPTNSPLPMNGSSGNPNIDAAMLPLWDDLNPSTGKVKYLSMGTAPNRVLVVSWLAAEYYCSGGGGCSVGRTTSTSATFQVQIYEQGQFVFSYGTVHNNGGSHASTRYSNQNGALAGWELTNTDYTQYAYQSGVLTSGTTLLFKRFLPGGVLSGKWWSRASTLALTEGNAVSTWSNESNNGNNLTAGTTKPVYRNNNGQNINFNPVVEFTATTASDAAAQYFQASSLMGSSTYNANYAAIVGYPTSSNQSNSIFYEVMATPGGESAGRLNFHLTWAGTELDWDAGSCCSSNRIQLASSSTVNTPSVFLLTRDTSAATTQSIRQNGSVIGSTTAVRATATGNNSMFRLGYSSATSGASPFRGLLAEGLVLAGSGLTSTQMAQIETYLGIKYGVTLGGAGATATSYVNAAGTTVWTANTGYHNNITGLGRDDTSGLDQRISRSTNSGDQITTTTNTTASLPDGSTTVSAQSGTAFSANTSFVIVGDNGSSASATTTIGSGTLVGYSRITRIWRLQTSGTVPTQLTLCIPDNLLPALYVSGTTYLALASDSGFTTNISTTAVAAGTCPGSGVGVTSGVSGRKVQISSATLTTLGSVAYVTLAQAPQLDHVEITTTATSGITCTPTTFTVKACANAACSSTYTGGLTGNLSLTGSGMSVVYPSGAGFTIASGNSTATVSAQVVTAGSVTASASGLSLTPSNSQPVFCGLGVAAALANSCSFTAADAGLLFDVPVHYAETSTSFTVKAVKKSDNSLACTPAFASVSKSINFKCSYTNPATGTLPARIGGAALNASNSTAAACDGTGRAVSLSFDATGTATTSFLYADVGQLGLTATYTGSGSDAGLTMTGTDSTTVAPNDFAISGLPGSAVAAGSSFSATVTARNALGTATPNFGRETSPESVVLGFLRLQPTGSAAAYGSFTGGTGSFSSGVASASNLSWTEVGKLNLVGRLTSGSYLASGLNAGLTDGGMVWCAVENATCSVPAGNVATVYYGVYQYGAYYALASQSGNVTCGNGVFGDPYYGVGKQCWYVVTSGPNLGTTVPVTVKPHHFDVTATQGCSSFTYAGQPLSTTVTARNAANATTVNYDGSLNTTPNFAKATTLAEATSMGVGSWSGTTIAAVGFTAGVGSATPTYTFTSKLTPAKTPVLRATDTDSVSSSGYTEPTLTLRSGRLRLSNAFGKSTASLLVPVNAEYWSGNAWVPNSSDNCTALAAANVATSNPRNALGNASTATTSTGAISLVNGQASLSFAAPSPAGSSVSYDVTVNLGSTTADQSCTASHPATTGAAKPWLRSSNGSCSALSDRDPSGRISFGIYSPETRKTVHVREMF